MADPKEVARRLDEERLRALQQREAGDALKGHTREAEGPNAHMAAEALQQTVRDDLWRQTIETPAPQAYHDLLQRLERISATDAVPQTTSAQAAAIATIQADAAGRSLPLADPPIAEQRMHDHPTARLAEVVEQLLVAIKRLTTVVERQALVIEQLTVAVRELAAKEQTQDQT